MGFLRLVGFRLGSGPGSLIYQDSGSGFVNGHSASGELQTQWPNGSLHKRNLSSNICMCLHVLWGVTIQSLMSQP